MAVNIGPKIGIDGEKEYRNQINNIIQATKTLDAQLDALSAEYKDNADSQDYSRERSKILTEQIENQQRKVQLLAEMVQKSSEKTGENSTTTLKWKEALAKAQENLYKTESATEDYTEAADDAGGKTNTFAENLKAHLCADAIYNAVAKLASKIADIAKDALSYNAAMESTNAALTAFVGDEEKAAEISERLQDSATNTGYQADSYLQLAQYLTSAGVNADEAADDIEALGKAIIAVGGSDDELERMGQNLQQISNNGKASAVDLKQFANAGINIYSLISESTGKTVEDLQDMDITYEMITDSLKVATSQGGELFAAAESQTLTYNTQINKLKANIQQGLGQAFSGLSTLLGTNVLPMLNDMVERFNDGTLALDDLVEEIYSKVYSAFNGLVDKAMEMMPQIVETGSNMLLSLSKGVADSLPELIAKVPELIGSFAKEIVNNLPTIIESGVTLIGSLARGLLEALPSFYQVILDIVDTIIDTILNTDWLQVGKNIINNIVSGIKTGKSAVSSAIESTTQTSSSGDTHGGGGSSWGDTTINVYGASGTTATDIANQVANKIRGKNAVWK